MSLHIGMVLIEGRRAEDASAILSSFRVAPTRRIRRTVDGEILGDYLDLERVFAVTHSDGWAVIVDPSLTLALDKEAIRNLSRTMRTRVFSFVCEGSSGSYIFYVAERGRLLRAYEYGDGEIDQQGAPLPIEEGLDLVNPFEDEILEIMGRYTGLEYGSIWENEMEVFEQYDPMTAMGAQISPIEVEGRWKAFQKGPVFRFANYFTGKQPEDVFGMVVKGLISIGAEAIEVQRPAHARALHGENGSDPRDRRGRKTIELLMTKSGDGTLVKVLMSSPQEERWDYIMEWKQLIKRRWGLIAGEIWDSIGGGLPQDRAMALMEEVDVEARIPERSRRAGLKIMVLGAGLLAIEAPLFLAIQVIVAEYHGMERTLISIALAAPALAGAYLFAWGYRMRHGQS